MSSGWLPLFPILAVAPMAACGAVSSIEEDAGSGADAGGPDGGTEQCAPACAAQDRDDDGEPAPPCGTDCDDADPSVRPGAADPREDGRDTDCDGVDGVDLDGDGFLSAEAGGDDCDDSRAFVHPDAPDGDGWVVESFPAGIRTQLVLDRWGKPVVAYAGWGGDLPCPDDEWFVTDGVSTVEVSRWNRVGWSSEVVAEACTEGGLGLGVAPGSTLIVAYTGFVPLDSDPDHGRPKLRVATSTGVRWDVDVVDDSRADVALVMDGCARPAIGYTWPHSGDPALDEGRVAQPLDGWSIETMQDGSGVDGIDLAATSAGRLAASYWLGIGTRDPTPVTYSFRESDSWQPEVIDDVPCYNCLWDTSVAMGPADEPEVAVIGQNGVWALRPLDAEWQRLELVDGPIWPSEITLEKPQTISLRVDGAGHSHLAYYDDDAVMYATDRSGSWSTEPVGAALSWGFAGGWPSLALDDLGGVHIAWYADREEAGSDLPPHSGRYAVLARRNDGVDQNCDGVDGVDADGDGRASIETGGDDPDDG